MNSYLTSTIKQFKYYKALGDKTIAKLSFDDLKKEFAQDSNSIAIIVKHLVGNMLSRWTNFLTEDGEKEWRRRDEEFVDNFTTKAELLKAWNDGWDSLFEAITPLNVSDLEKTIYIRNGGHSVTEAINRQMMHYAYHVGQMVFIGKIIKGNEWKSLSIAKGQSKAYNKNKFQQDKNPRHFTDDV
ncbi:DinB family protein [Winogradskyella helgolandensis]|uniref:DinB family protein n=1 Tax=Winogradskyella helgolandensis TaxID=2697010 RepID=UPI0015C7C47B|nr:DinB family protein [Winogradskyella helgolandensis]